MATPDEFLEIDASDVDVTVDVEEDMMQEKEARTNVKIS